MIHSNPLALIERIKHEFPNETVGFGFIHDYLSPYHALSSITLSVKRNYHDREEASILLAVLAVEVSLKPRITTPISLGKNVKGC